MGRGVFLGVYEYTPIPQGGGAQAQLNFGGSVLFMHTPFDAELPNFTLYHLWEENLFYVVSHAPTRKGVKSQPSPMACTLSRRNTKFDVVTHGRDVYLGVSNASHLKRAVFQRSPIWGFSCTYAYTL